MSDVARSAGFVYRRRSAALAVPEPGTWRTAKTELSAYVLLARDGSLAKMRQDLAVGGGHAPTRHKVAWAWWNTVQKKIPTLFHVLAKTCALAPPSVGLFALLPAASFFPFSFFWLHLLWYWYWSWC